MNKEYIVDVHINQFLTVPVKVYAENNELALNQVQGMIHGEWTNFIDVGGNSVRVKSGSINALTCQGAMA